MTIVVYKDGVMGVDTQISHGGCKCGVVQKSFHVVDSKTGDQFLLGVAGGAANMVLCQRYIVERINDGMWNVVKMELETGNFDAILAHKKKDGGVNTYWIAEKGTLYPALNWYLVTGSGKNYAAGALEMGASVEAAVDIAMRLDIDCGGSIEVKRFLTDEELTPVPDDSPITDDIDEHAVIDNDITTNDD